MHRNRTTLNWYWARTLSLLLCFGILCSVEGAEKLAARLLIVPKSADASAKLEKVHANKGRKLGKKLKDANNLHVVTLPAGEDAQKVITEYLASGLVEIAEP